MERLSHNQCRERKRIPLEIPETKSPNDFLVMTRDQNRYDSISMRKN